MTNPLFSTYKQGENRVTSSILAALERVSFALVERIFQALFEEPEVQLLTFTNQPSGKGSTPDGRIGASFAYWIETKIVPNAVQNKQIQSHIRALDADKVSARQRLLVLTPDAQRPTALATIQDERVRWANFDMLLQAIQELVIPGEDWLITDKPVPTEQERAILRELVRFLIAENLVGRLGDQVLVVAASRALPAYIRYSAYMCQPNRSFQPTSHMAFYADGRIAIYVPQILEKIEEVTLTREAILANSTISDELRASLLNLVAKLEAEKDYRLGEVYKVMFLSPTDSPDTMHLSHDVINDLKSSSGRSMPFTQGHRYVPLSKLKGNPKTTTELLGDKES